VTRRSPNGASSHILVPAGMTHTRSSEPTEVIPHRARVIVPGLRYTALEDKRPEVGRMLHDAYSHRTDAEPYVSPFTAELTGAEE
jgi:hypothetical protein